MKSTLTQRIASLFLLLQVFACDEAPLIVPQGPNRLNAPSSISVVPGTQLAIIANANVNLDQKTGSLVALDMSSNTLLIDTLFDIPNFAGDFYIDAANKKIYVPDRDEALLVYKYKVPGDNGTAISFSSVSVSQPIDSQRPNGIRTDDHPTQALVVGDTSLGDLILVTNQKGTVSMIPTSTLKFKDKDSDDDIYGLRLIAASNFQNRDNFPGNGASRMAIDPVTELVYITSPLNNQIYVLDPEDQVIEAMIDLGIVSNPTVGMREMIIDMNGIAYIAHSGLDSVLMVDIAGITKNGIPYEVINPPVLIIPVGAGPESLQLSSTNQLYVSNQNEDSVYMIDVATRTIVNRLYLDEGKNPGRLLLDEANNILYCLNFLSNSISLINPTTGTLIRDIQ